MVPGSAKSESADTLFRIEPTLLDVVPGEVNDLAAELAAASLRLGASLHPTTAASLADLVRIMNTYYSWPATHPYGPKVSHISITAAQMVDCGRSINFDTSAWYL